MRIKENKTRTKLLSHSVSILTQIAEYRIENDKTNEPNDKKSSHCYSKQQREKKNWNARPLFAIVTQKMHDKWLKMKSLEFALARIVCARAQFYLHF